MDPEQRPARPFRPWPIPVAVLLGALALVAVPRYVTKGTLSYEMARDGGAKQGIALAERNPKVGTDIYQWDPEIEDAPPLRLGAVIDSDVPSHRGHLVRIKSPNRLLNGACLDIDPHQLRYWVRR